MTEIAYLLLAHRAPGTLLPLVRALVAAGDRVALHYDARAPRAEFEALRAGLAGEASVVFAPRIRCGWGEWSLVAATLGAARAALAAFPGATHLVMLSGDCLPIRSRAEIAEVLARDGRDHIESHDFFGSGWIRIGLREERLVYRHYVNERSRKRLFYLLLEAQKRLGLRRALPRDLPIRIGSQWWALRRATVEKVLAFLAARPDVPRFFRTTWIPDETFFQTLVPHLVPREEIAGRRLTFLAFSDYGMPMVLHDDHAALLDAEDHLFARKVSPGAARLRAALLARYAARGDGAAAPRRGNGEALYRFVTARGREGRRHGPRIWEAGGTVGRDRTVLLVLCRKWHVARRLAAGAAALGLSAFGHVFDEAEAGLPWLGGHGTSVAKRERHRRAFLRVLFEATGARRILLCLDPGRAGVVADLAADGCRLGLLEIRPHLDRAWQEGHAERIGLLPPAAPPGLAAPVLAELARALGEEDEALARFAPARIREGEAPEVLAGTVAAFLGVTEAEAAGIVCRPGFFD